MIRSLLRSPDAHVAHSANFMFHFFEDNCSTQYTINKNFHLAHLCHSISLRKHVSQLHFKIMTEKGLLEIACEQFMGKEVEDIKTIINQTLDGHLRAILGRFLD